MRPIHLAALALSASLVTACSSENDSRTGDDGTGGTWPGFPGAGAGGPEPLPGATLSCYYGDDPASPAASVEHVLEVVDGAEALHVRLTLDPAFVDNTYGVNAVGWSETKKGVHTFEDLIKSDRAQMVFGAGGATALDLMVDYLSESTAATSGYATLGVGGGEGEVMAGDGAAVLLSSTSMDRNLNKRGYGAYLVDSPPTDEMWTPSAEAPDWDYRVVYETWIATAAVGAAPDVTIDYIHASPSKAADNTLVVEPEPCPPDWGCQEPDGCNDDGGDGDDSCNEPDGCNDDGGGNDPIE